MTDPWVQSRVERRAAQRARVRRQRAIAGALAGAIAVACLVVFLVLPAFSGRGGSPAARSDGDPDGVPSPGASSAAADGTIAAADSPEATPVPQPMPSASSSSDASRSSKSPSPSDSPSASSSPSSAPRAAAGDARSSAALKPAIVAKPIDFGATRQAEMADYSQRHYGEHTVRLSPKVVLLHYTAGGSWQSAWNYFAQDAADPEYHELPGPVAHFIVDKDGTIYQLLPTDKRGRHVVGLNHRAIGIEFVQEAGSTAEEQILGRRAQRDAGLALVRYLMARYDIPEKDVIGHAMANDSRYFKDLQGWHNTHGDWPAEDVRRFRALL